MRVIFLYTSLGAAGAGTKPPWDSKVESNNHFVGEHGLPTEGYFHMLRKLKEKGVIDGLLVFIESYRSPGFRVIEGIQCYVVPRIEYVEPFLQEDDVLFVRGGFRGWYDPFLLKMQKQKRWLLLYAANTGRQRWTVWDVIFSDLTAQFTCDKRGRFWFFFKKPINPEIFHPIKIKRTMDVCIGASKIHDKKGQWMTIDALIQYKKMFGEALKCVMPGSIRYRGKETPLIPKKIEEHGLNVVMPGFLNRYELNKILNHCKLFVYLGNSGENDRGPLEATSVGCLTLLGGETRHAPFLRGGWNKGIMIAKDPTNAAAVADQINDLLKLHSEEARESVASHFDEHNGFDSVVIPEMKRLFGVIRNNPVPDIEALRKEYC